jgi:DNA-binding transcriptional LysR family regulator
VALSAAGLALYERTAPLLRSLEDAFGSLPEREEEPSGELRITTPNDFGAESLAQMLPPFMRRYPKVGVDVRLTNRTVDLVAEGFDLALRAASLTPPDSSLVMRRLSAIEIQLYAAPSYLAHRGKSAQRGGDRRPRLGSVSQFQHGSAPRGRA